MSGRADETWFLLRFVTVGWAQPWGSRSIRGEGKPAAAFPGVGHWQRSGDLLRQRWGCFGSAAWGIVFVEGFWTPRIASPCWTGADQIHTRRTEGLTCSGRRDLLDFGGISHTATGRSVSQQNVSILLDANAAQNPQPVPGGAHPMIFSGISHVARGEPYQHISPPSTTLVFRLVCISPCAVRILWMPQLPGHTLHVTSTLRTGELELATDFKIFKGSLKGRQEGNTQSSGNHFCVCVCVSQTKNILLWFFNWDKERCFPILFMPGFFHTFNSILRYSDCLESNTWNPVISALMIQGASEVQSPTSSTGI